MPAKHPALPGTLAALAEFGRPAFIVCDSCGRFTVPTQTANVTNPAGKFRQAVFGTPADRQKAAIMLPSGAVKDFEDLMFAAEKLASTPIAGSNTMRDTEIKDQLKGTGAVLFRWLSSPRQSVISGAEQRALEQGTIQITEALLDPAKRSQLRRVVKMAPSTRQAIMITSILSGQSLKVAAQSDEEFIPPASREAKPRISAAQMARPNPKGT